MLKQLPQGIDAWDIYHALLRSYDALGAHTVIEAVSPTHLHLAARLVAAQCMETSDPIVPFEFPGRFNHR